MAERHGRARDHVARLINQATPVVNEWMTRRRRTDLPQFLVAMADVPAAQVLADPHGARDAHEHLLVRWSATVTMLARPDSLPEVVRRRELVRLHPAAPLTTAAVASGGSVAVVAANLATPLEALGVVGVVLATAAASAVAWKPRPRARDRSYTLYGTPALVARAQAELADHGLAALTAAPQTQAESEDALTRLLGSAAQLESLEDQALRLALIDEHGALDQPATTPAEQAVVDELVARRLDLVQALVRLGSLGQNERARQRREEREGYGFDDH